MHGPGRTSQCFGTMQRAAARSNTACKEVLTSPFIKMYQEQLSHCPIHTPCSACPVAAAVPCETRTETQQMCPEAENKAKRCRGVA